MKYNILDVECTDKNLFRAAVTHPSYTSEHGLSFTQNYERLEFFGDAVLKLFSSKLLINKYPDYNEGKLSQIRSILVADSTICKITKEIGLNKLIRLSISEEKQGGRDRESNVACVFEAVLGAYYLDGKINEIEMFLNDYLMDYIEKIDKNFEEYNAKATLQEYTQSKTKELPVYETIGVSGPEHKPTFEVCVKYMGKILATSTGLSKKEAQQKCAYIACKKLGIIKE